MVPGTLHVKIGNHPPFGRTVTAPLSLAGTGQTAQIIGELALQKFFGLRAIGMNKPQFTTQEGKLDGG